MKNWIKALIITCLAVPTMQVLVLNPFEQAADFSMSDFFIRTSNKVHPSIVLNQVAIVSVDDLSRLEIAQVVEKVDYCGAKVVALDVFMNWNTDDDNEVVRSLSSCENLILPSSLTDNVLSPVFQKVNGAVYGYTNLECNWPGAQIRTFSAGDNDMLSFAAAACDYKNPDLSGIIRYDCRDIEIIYPQEVSFETVQGKIVFVGNINDFSDCHPTPVGVLPGVMIHAYIARTLLENCTPKPLSKPICIILSFVLIYLLTLMHSYNNDIDSDFANFIMRLVQLLVSIALYFVGAILFIRFNCYADISLVLLYIAAMLLVFDVIYGFISIYILIKKKIRNKTNNIQDEKDTTAHIDDHSATY